MNTINNNGPNGQNYFTDNNQNNDHPNNNLNTTGDTTYGNFDSTSGNKRNDNSQHYFQKNQHQQYGPNFTTPDPYTGPHNTNYNNNYPPNVQSN